MQSMAVFSYRLAWLAIIIAVMTVVFATLKARPERVDQVRHELLDLKRLTFAEPGALGYAVYGGADGVFVVFERYVDQAACDAHFAAPYVNAFFARVPELLTGEPQVQIVDEVSTFSRS
jgi:quinol monooxygenase YgiN